MHIQVEKARSLGPATFQFSHCIFTFHSGLAFRRAAGKNLTENCDANPASKTGQQTQSLQKLE